MSKIKTLFNDTKSAFFGAVIGGLVIFIVGGVLLVAGLHYYKTRVFQYLASDYMRSSTSQPASSSAGFQFLTQEQLVVGAVKKANPAVVSIIISKNVPVMEQYFSSPFGGDPFFGQFGFQIPQYRQKGTKKQDVGGGSGFFVSSDGYILTNKHVVADTTAEYTVFTNDGKKYNAKVIARDPVLDLAIIKVAGSDFPYLDFADSNKINIGQSVIAIGNALGEFRNTVSVGVVSGLSRTITAGDGSGNTEKLDKVIQTDAAINPGNSGGPLLDLSGQVVGIDVATAQGSQNIGFALPANSAKLVVESVKKTGKIIRPSLGLRYMQINKDVQDKNHLAVDYGALVVRGQMPSDLAVIPGSAADKAGIVENDIIIEVDGVKLDTDHDLTTIIRQHKPGDIITIKLIDKGVQKTITVKLQETNG